MANTTSCYVDIHSGCLLTVTLTETPNESENSSTVTCSYVVSVPSSWGQYDFYDIPSTTICSYSIDGGATWTDTLVTATAKLSNNASIGVKSCVVLTTTHTFAHDADGSKSVSMNFYYNRTDTSNRYRGTCSISNWALTKFARASTISATDANIGSTSVITVAQASSAYTHSIAYKLGSASGYVTEAGGSTTSEVKMSATSIGWKVPTAFYAQLPSATSGTCTLTIKTYNGSTQIGDAQTCTFTATVSASNAPTITNIVAEDQNSTTVALTGDSTKQVKYYSNTQISFTATALHSASVSATSIGGESTGATGSPSRTISNYEGGTQELTVTDSRGFATSKSYTPTLIDYIILTNNAVCARPAPTDGSCRITFSGDYYNGSFGVADNTLTLQYRYAESGSETYTAWATVAATIDENAYTAVVNLSGFTYTLDYSIQVQAIDALATVTKTLSLHAGVPVFDWGKKDFNFNVPISINGKYIDATNFRITNISLDEGDSVSFSTYSRGAGIYLGSVSTVGGDTRIFYWDSGNITYALNARGDTSALTIARSSGTVTLTMNSGTARGLLLLTHQY